MTSIVKRFSPTALFLVIVIIVMAVFFVTSMSYEELKVKLMPAIISGATIVLSLIALYNDLKSGSKASMPTDEDGDVIEDEKIVGTPLVDYFKAFLWFAAMIACVYILGFLIAIPVWMIIYLWKNGTKWWSAIPQGIVLTIIIYVVFTTLLQIELYKGIVGGFLFGLLGL
jgi:hypothetical protein